MKFCNLREKDMVLKFNPKLNSKFMLKESKTIAKLEINTSKIYISFYAFCFFLKNIFSGCVVSSEHRVDILNAKSVGKEHLNVFITERFIEKTVSS